jgi:hypothetical protein
MQILWGSIAASGAITSSGGGFTCKNASPGTYTLTWTTPFASVPAVVVSQNNYGPGEWANDVADVPSATAASATVITGSSTVGPALSNRAFGFIAVGN